MFYIPFVVHFGRRLPLPVCQHVRRLPPPYADWPMGDEVMQQMDPFLGLGASNIENPVRTDDMDRAS